MNTKKIKTVIALCVVVIISLLGVSIFLTTKIFIAKQKLADQNNKIQELEQVVNNYENLPNNDNEEIIY